MTVVEQPRVRVLDRAEIIKERKHLIEDVGGDEKGFRERARKHLLSNREAALYTRLRGLDYLIQDE